MRVSLEVVRAFGVELRCGRVDRQCDVLAGSESGLADRLDDQVQRRPVVLEVGGEAALVVDARGPAAGSRRHAL